MEGEIQVNELLKKDIFIRIISMVFAITLWLFVLSDINPYNTVYISVPIQILNENSIQEKGLEIKNKAYQKEITVAVEGRTDLIQSVDSSYFEAFADLSKATNIGSNDVAIEFIKLKDSINVKNYNPVSIKLEIEKVEEKTFTISVKPEGVLKDKFSVIWSSVAPEAIAIRGMESMVKSIGSAVVSIDVTGLDKNLTVKKDCRINDIYGNEMTELSGRYIVDVNIGVAKEVPVVPVIQGKVSSDYIEKERLVYPNSVLITGTVDVLNGISEIRTNAVNIEGYTGNLDVKVPLSIPEGVTLYNSSNEAKVNVIVDQLATREFNISKSEIKLVNDNPSQDYIVEIITSNVSVKVRGTRDEVEKLEQSKLTPSISLNYLAEGINKLPLNIVLTDYVKLVEDIFVEVKVSKIEIITPSPSPSPTVSPTPNGQ